MFEFVALPTLRILHLKLFVIGSQPVDMGIGRGDSADFFAGEIGEQPPLPELVFAFNFAFARGVGA